MRRRSVYAIMVCLDGKDDWIFVTKDTGRCDWNLEPMLFEDVHSALDVARTFEIEGKEHNVKVVSYEE
jgi:hypothetical protein